MAKQYLIVVNSYGRDAGDNGKHYITRETVNHFAKRYGMMMGVDLPAEKAKYYANNNIKESDYWFVQIYKSFKTMLCLTKQHI